MTADGVRRERLIDAVRNAIELDLWVTADELAELDRGRDVERVEDLVDELNDLVAAGLEAIKNSLLEKYGEDIAEIWVRR